MEQSWTFWKKYAMDELGNPKQYWKNILKKQYKEIHVVEIKDMGDRFKVRFTVEEKDLIKTPMEKKLDNTLFKSRFDEIKKDEGKSIVL